LAIGGVIVDHFGTSAGINLGRLGVELFFVLSGRLMAQILFIDAVHLGPFFYRRFSRVYPTVITLVFGLLAASWILHKPLINAVGALSALTYTYNYMSISSYRAGAIDHLWSLCVEEHTYLYLGFLALIVRRFPRSLVIVLAITIVGSALDGVLSTYLLDQTYYEVYWRTDVRMASILMGALCFVLKKRERCCLRGPWPLVVGLAGLILNVNAIPDPVKYTLGSACLALAVANVDEADFLVKDALSRPFLVWVGLISFSLYMWQQPFAMMRPHPVILRIFPLAGAVSFAISSFYLIERPARRWLNAHPPHWACTPTLYAFARPTPGVDDRQPTRYTSGDTEASDL
jgi:peptidoglycan/LPS O-acetylase OafA/YrhL